MRVDFLYFPGCPSHEEALERLHDALAQEHIRVEPVVYCIETEEEARQNRFLGSPTIRVNGVDIDPAFSEETSFRLTCRLYLREDGRPSPLPSITMIRNALKARHESEERR
ncbi:MAG: DUF2703 domain-containing protein [Fimbriimonadia bacterium]|nr:DUF2703 domain-containing protein [Fimbriimonadia bacterium]